MRKPEDLFDNLVRKLDTSIKTIAGGKTGSNRYSPSKNLSEAQMIDQDKDKVARLMRINHCGEVCAQALYEGQALASRSKETSSTLAIAASEEEDHLFWCEQRIEELGGRLSYLNPLFYASSYGLGMLAGALGSRINLGFLAATEEEVCHHLRDHLSQVPEEDSRSRAILEQMLVDEANHASTALESGGSVFPDAVKKLMRSVSNLMTKTVYWV